MEGLPNQSMAQGPFDEAVAKYMTELPLRGAEENALAADVSIKQALASEAAAAAAASQIAAKASADAAVLATNTTKWISGKVYAEGETVWSPMDSQTYRRKTAGAGMADPSLDSANWKMLAGFSPGDLLLTARRLDSPAWLPSNGADYMASSYPGLAGLLGPVRDLIKLPDPASLPAASISGISYSGDGVYAALSNFTTPFISVYKQVSGAYVKLADLPTITNTGNCVGFSPDGVHLAVGGENSPFLTIYKRTGDTFAKLTVTTGITAVVSALAFSPDGTHLVVGHDNTPFMSIFKRVGDVFTKLANPATIPSGASVRSVAFSPDGQHVMIGKTSAPNMMIYKRTGDVFTNLTSVPALSGNNVSSAAYSPDNKYLVTAQFLAPYFAVYVRSIDTYTQVYNISKSPVQEPSGIAFSQITGELAISVRAAPGVAVYQRNGDDFKISEGFPSIAAAGSVAFSPVGYDLAIGLIASPYLNVLRGVPDSTRVRVPNLPSSDSRLINYIKT